MNKMGWSDAEIRGSEADRHHGYPEFNLNKWCAIAFCCLHSGWGHQRQNAYVLCHAGQVVPKASLYSIADSWREQADGNARSVVRT